MYWFSKGKIQLQEFSVFYISTYPFRFPLKNPRQCFFKLSLPHWLHSNQTNDSEQSHLPETKLLESGEFEAPNHTDQWKYSKGLLMIRKFKVPSLNNKRQHQQERHRICLVCLCLKDKSFGLLERKSIFYLQLFFLSSSLPFSTTWFRPCIKSEIQTLATKLNTEACAS